jgi:hypothetical protein
VADNLTTAESVWRVTWSCRHTTTGSGTSEINEIRTKRKYLSPCPACTEAERQERIACLQKMQEELDEILLKLSELPPDSESYGT